MLFIARSDLRRALRQRETWLWTFLMPLVFFYFFTLLQSGSSGSSRGSTGGKPEPLTLVSPHDGVLVDELERRLGEVGFEVKRVAVLDPLAAPPARLVELRANFSRDVLEGVGSTVDFTREGGGNAYEFERFRVTRASLGVLADTIALAAAGDGFEPVNFAQLRAQPRTLQIESRPAGKRGTIPSGSEQSIPGTMVMFTMILLLMSSGMAIVVERRQGLLRRLAATPISRAQLALGRWLSIFGLGALQLGYALVVGALGFGVRWGPDPAALLAVLAVLGAWAAFNASLALALASAVRTEGQVVGVSVLSANILAALGGCWWPIEVAPRWMQELASWLPTGWVMNALHRLMVFHSGPSASALPLLWLACGALALGWLGARRFRYE